MIFVLLYQGRPNECYSTPLNVDQPVRFIFYFFTTFPIPPKLASDPFPAVFCPSRDPNSQYNAAPDHKICFQSLVSPFPLECSPSRITPLFCYLRISMKPRIHREHILKSHLPRVESIPNIDIYTFIFEREKHGNYPPIKSPDRVAHINGLTGERILFRELKTRVNSLARSLRHTIGIHDHDVVCF